MESRVQSESSSVTIECDSDGLGRSLFASLGIGSESFAEQGTEHRRVQSFANALRGA